jgi:hypothetical protein
MVDDDISDPTRPSPRHNRSHDELLREYEQRQKHEEQQRQQREARIKREYGDLLVQWIEGACTGREDEQTKARAADYLAKELSNFQGRPDLKDFSRLSGRSLAQASKFEEEQRQQEPTMQAVLEEKQQKPEAARPSQLNQSIEPAMPSQPDPRRQWLGKFAELKKLSPQGERDAPSAEVGRRQREESDKRQTLTPEARSDEREPTEQEHREASIEQTERKLTAYERARRGLSADVGRQTDRPESRSADRPGDRDGGRGR